MESNQRMSYKCIMENETCDKELIFYFSNNPQVSDDPFRVRCRVHFRRLDLLYIKEITREDYELGVILND
jgi:hypothetical protein